MANNKRKFIKNPFSIDKLFTCYGASQRPYDFEKTLFMAGLNRLNDEPEKVNYKRSDRFKRRRSFDCRSPAYEHHWISEFPDEEDINTKNGHFDEDILNSPMLEDFFRDVCRSDVIDEPTPCCSKSLEKKDEDNEMSVHNENESQMQEITVWLYPIKRPENDTEAKNFNLADLF